MLVTKSLAGRYEKHGGSLRKSMAGRRGLGNLRGGDLRQKSDLWKCEAGWTGENWTKISRGVTPRDRSLLFTINFALLTLIYLFFTSFFANFTAKIATSPHSYIIFSRLKVEFIVPPLSFVQNIVKLLEKYGDSPHRPVVAALFTVILVLFPYLQQCNSWEMSPFLRQNARLHRPNIIKKIKVKSVECVNFL